MPSGSARWLTPQIVGQTIASTLDIFAMLAFLILIASIVFSSLIYFAERGTYNEDAGVWVNNFGFQSQFQDIPQAFYWTIVSISTVGYGAHQSIDIPR